LDIKKLLGNKISGIRKSKGYSQMQFAEMLGISTNALSLIETGNGFLTAETLEKVLDKLNLEPDELFSFGINKDEKEIYSDILKLLENVKNDKQKLSVVYAFVKQVV